MTEISQDSCFELSCLIEIQNLLKILQSVSLPLEVQRLQAQHAHERRCIVEDLPTIIYDEDGSELTLKGDRPMSASEQLQHLECKENKAIIKRAKAAERLTTKRVQTTEKKLQKANKTRFL